MRNTALVYSTKPLDLNIYLEGRSGKESKRLTTEKVVSILNCKKLIKVIAVIIKETHLWVFN